MSKELRGRIRIRKSDMEVIDSVSEDGDSEYAFEKAVYWAKLLIQNGAPEEYTVTTG